jgi:hypothetical protein
MSDLFVYLRDWCHVIIYAGELGLAGDWSWVRCHTVQDTTSICRLMGRIDQCYSCQCLTRAPGILQWSNT